MCAVIPSSTNGITIYNGRGLTREDALLGAVMEAVERQSAAACDVPECISTPCEAAARTVDLARAGLRNEYVRTPMPFVAARDLLTDESLIVPKALVQVPWRGAPAFGGSHTNGLAAAFTWIAAVRNALLELLERHLWSTMHERAHLRPERILRELLGSDVPFIDDPVPEIQLPTGDARIDALHDRILAAGLTLRIVSVGNGDLPPAMSASIHEREEKRVHFGMGCDWSPAIATLKAITEAVQARVADTHAARENIVRYTDPPSPFSDHTRRRRGLPYGRWYFDGPTVPLKLLALPDRSSLNPAHEVQALLECIATLAPQIALVDLAPGETTYAVVRAIVPELDTWLIDGRAGNVDNSASDAAPALESLR